VRVELRDTSRADAAARPLATQTIPANQGPPFHYALAVSRATIDPRAHLSLFAEIRDEDRLLFNDLAKNNRIDTLDELLSVTTFHDTGENTYQLDWDGGKASVSLEVVPGMFVQPPDIYDNFTSLQQFSAVFHIDFT